MVLQSLLIHDINLPFIVIFSFIHPEVQQAKSLNTVFLSHLHHKADNEYVEKSVHFVSEAETPVSKQQLSLQSRK